MNKVDIRLEVKESNLRDEIDAWKDASGLQIRCLPNSDEIPNPKMLEKHIDDLNQLIVDVEIKRDYAQILNGEWESVASKICVNHSTENPPTPKMLEKHIANLDRNIKALDKSSSIWQQRSDHLWNIIHGMKCQNMVVNIISRIFDVTEKCGRCDVCIAQAKMSGYEK